ncbi:MAG: hypothetical protein KBT03_09620 [Bacteroidales bacterium]|nr:hypothetical protein [Candidatus Scybalousia scybalohippi]
MVEQPYLDNFLQAEAEARESTIPVRARQRHLGNLYWKYRKMASKCPVNQHDNIIRAWKMGQFFERQR